MGETWCSCLSQWTEGLPDRQALSSPCPCQIFQKEHKSSEGGEGKRERESEREGGRERERGSHQYKTHIKDISIFISHTLDATCY